MARVFGFTYNAGNTIAGRLELYLQRTENSRTNICPNLEKINYALLVIFVKYNIHCIGLYTIKKLY